MKVGSEEWIEKMMQPGALEAEAQRFQDEFRPLYMGFCDRYPSLVIYSLFKQLLESIETENPELLALWKETKQNG